MSNTSEADFPTLPEAAAVVFTTEELQRLRSNLTVEKIGHAKYMREHPEIDMVMRCAMQLLLDKRPDDPIPVLLDFFANADLPAEVERFKKEKN